MATTERTIRLGGAELALAKALISGRVQAPAAWLGGSDAGVVSDDELVERALAKGIVISPAAIAAESRKLLQKSGIYSPTETQLATARRGAIESYLLNVRASEMAS
jgi:hypothetical protein